MQQTSTHKSLAGHSLYIFIARFFPALANLVAFILYAHWLDASQYGQYQNFWIQLLVLAAVGGLGIPAFVITYAPPFLVQLYRSVTRRHMLLFGLLAIALATILAGLQYRINALPFYISSLFFLLYIPTILTESFLLAGRAYKALIGINIFYSLFFCTAHALVYLQGYSLASLLKALLIVTASRLVANCMALKKVYAGITPPADQPVHCASVRSLWFYLGVNDLLQVLFRWIDKFLLSLLLSSELLAVYFNATIDIPFLPIIFSAVSSAALMRFADGKVHISDKIRLLHQSSKLLSSMVFPLFFFFLFFSTEFLTVLFSKTYEVGVPVFICAILVLPVRAYPFTSVLQHHGAGRIITAGAVADLVLACVLMYPLYLLLGLPGVALAFVISTYLQALYYLYQSARILDRPVLALMPWRNLLVKAAVAAVLTGSLRYFLSKTDIADAATLSAGLLLAVALAFFFLSREIKRPA